MRCVNELQQLEINEKRNINYLSDQSRFRSDHFKLIEISNKSENSHFNAFLFCLSGTLANFEQQQQHTWALTQDCGFQRL